MQEKPETKALPTEELIKELKSGSYLVRLKKDEEEFYFDSSDLGQNEDKFKAMVDEGWQIAEKEELPAYLPARKQKIEEKGLEEEDWGYRKK